ncbi:MAG: hypothetical protein WD232_01115 [Acidimicrobiales bacterium]
MRQLAALLMSLALLVACGDEGADEVGEEATDEAVFRGEAEARPCSEVFGPREMASSKPGPCSDDGVLIVPGIASSECSDGRVLVHNDYAWGYVGEPWNPHEPGAEPVPPEPELDACFS